MLSRGPQGLAQAADHIAHRAPSRDIAGSELAYLPLTTLVILPQLHARAVEEGKKEAIDCWSPMKAALDEAELFDNERMEQAGKIGAGRHPHPRKGLLDRACASHPFTALEHQHTLSGARQVCGAGQAVVARAHDDGVP